MAYFGRGKFPNFGKFKTGGSSRFGIGLFRRFYYIPLDNTYVVMQMIMSFVILIIGILTFLLTYKSKIVDPIQEIKETFINTHLIVIGIILIINLIISCLSKKEKKLLERLILLVMISILFFIAFFAIKLNLDKTYTKNKFEQICEEQNHFKENSLKSMIDFTTMSIKSEKEYYIIECMKSYSIFKIRTYIILGLHLLLNILFIYQISKLQKIQIKKERLDKDEAILFDEEQNIRF